MSVPHGICLTSAEKKVWSSRQGEIFVDDTDLVKTASQRSNPLNQQLKGFANLLTVPTLDYIRQEAASAPKMLSLAFKVQGD
jgi:hypothetical protein